MVGWCHNGKSLERRGLDCWNMRTSRLKLCPANIKTRLFVQTNFFCPKKRKKYSSKNAYSYKKLSNPGGKNYYSRTNVQWDFSFFPGGRHISEGKTDKADIFFNYYFLDNKCKMKLKLSQLYLIVPIIIVWNNFKASRTVKKGVKFATILMVQRVSAGL